MIKTAPPSFCLYCFKSHKTGRYWSPENQRRNIVRLPSQKWDKDEVMSNKVQRPRYQDETCHKFGLQVAQQAMWKLDPGGSYTLNELRFLFQCSWWTSNSTDHAHPSAVQTVQNPINNTLTVNSHQSSELCNLTTEVFPLRLMGRTLETSETTSQKSNVGTHFPNI